MKNIFSKIVLLIISVIVVVFSCADDDIPPIGTAFSQVSGIQDDWTLVAVKQVDELTGSEDNTIDVSSVIIGNTPATITFNATEYNSNTGSSKILFPSSGRWSFDNNEFPSQINVESGGNQISLIMQAPVRENVDEKLSFKFVRPFGTCAGVEDKVGAVGYIYEFQR